MRVCDLCSDRKEALWKIDAIRLSGVYAKGEGEKSFDLCSNCFNKLTLHASLL
mgnify:FL=1